MPRRKKNLEELVELSKTVAAISDKPPSDSPSETLTDETGDLEWSSDIEKLLDNIRQNCGTMSKYYKLRYMHLKNQLIYYRIPLIILGSVNSVFAVGLTVYLAQKIVSTINCILSLICAIITSTELYLGINSSMEKALISQRDFYLLAVEIYSILSLEREHRSINAKKFLDNTISQYNKYIENGDVIRNKIKDKLIPLAEVDNQNLSINNITLSNKNLNNSIYGEDSV